MSQESRLETLIREQCVTVTPDKKSCEWTDREIAADLSKFTGSTIEAYCEACGEWHTFCPP